jgi:DNA-binding NarL/FixJ family response regulator
MKSNNESDAAEKPAKANTPGKPRRVVVVDDHPILRRGLVELIAEEPDLEVCADVGSPDDALKAARQKRPDLMIVDVALEQSNGIELTRQIKLMYSHIPVLVLSMHEEVLYAERALRAGANGYVMKTEPPEALLKAVRDVLDGGFYVGGHIATQLLRGFIENSAGPAARNGIEALSDRELEVFELIGRGLTTRDAAEHLHLSVKTVETHRSHIKAKLGLKSATELVQHAVRWVGDGG